MRASVSNFVKRFCTLGCVVALISLSACSTFNPREAVPVSERKHTSILGLPNGRFFVDQPAMMSAEQELSLEREARALGVPKGGVLPTAYVLSLSGGGDNGAFGAGLLSGWTKHGGRPRFKLVTGVSTGALIAPFAFLGPEYDAALTDVYTNINPSKVYEKRFTPYAALAQNALSDSAPLYDTIAHYLDESMLLRIAEEYRKGRLLLIQTTDLDAGRPVIWNIGALAASGDPRAPDLIRHILLASASIPAAFPPVFFDVDAGGKAYREMHVDGGAVSQAFLVPPSVNTHAALERSGYRRKASVAYVIRNSRLTTSWSDVEDVTLPIAEKAVSTMINYNGVSDLYRMYLVTQRAGASFNMAYVGEDFQAPHPEEFDQTFMRALYHYAFEKASKGYPWEHAPPGFGGK
ncbi:patatin-like phospholipase family protein [Methylocystis parvus]|uniref:Patatin family protein n=1 Tax=Methylocystis parvus TaxID=134 RepID=A0A6B8M599_9HYPH|nr:patatin-like phospholipase family protein [Methylocystis parvus]QGM97588.1 patatin family protein [Methylocystis parvus]WBJ98480.1 patatin-like phospholipase family protein [Methylocystis parvus OBBP]